MITSKMKASSIYKDKNSKSEMNVFTRGTKTIKNLDLDTNSSNHSRNIQSPDLKKKYSRNQMKTLWEEGPHDHLHTMKDNIEDLRNNPYKFNSRSRFSQKG